MAPIQMTEESDSSMRKRLVNSLSQSFPGSALSRMLHSMSEDAEPFENSSDEEHDQLSLSCFSEIHIDKVPVDDDDELTSLAWLHDSELIKSVPALEQENEDLSNEKENGATMGRAASPPNHPAHIPYNPQKHITSKPPYSFSCLIFMAVEDSLEKKLPVKDIYTWILTHFPFFQSAPTGWKNSVRHNLSLNKCFKKVDKDKGQSIGKGSLWCIDPDYRPNLLQALRKTPYHPYHQLQLANPSQQHYSLPGSGRAQPLAPRDNFNGVSPHLFPFLSRRLNTSTKPELESDIDVANTLVSLKGLGFYNGAHKSNPRLKPLNGCMQQRHRSPSPPEFGHERSSKQKRGLRRRPLFPERKPIIVTLNPSEDHTYSASCTPSDMSDTSSIDEPYEFGESMQDDDDDFHEVQGRDGYHSEMSEYESEAEDARYNNSPGVKGSSGCQTSDIIISDDDETQKIVEGADALLNLAGIKTSSVVPMRPISPMDGVQAS